jgi:predicted MFS family arabinose efflux permease
MIESSPVRASPFGPFRHRIFTLIWLATVVSNIGGWMSSAASAWLMTSLDGSALTVAMVQAAASLPLFLFAIPAGALSDIVDRRKFLLVGEISIMVISVGFAWLVSRRLIGPTNLLLLTFVASTASAATAPAWQAVVNRLVPKADLPAAVALNSTGINISRAVGPALGGLLISLYGIVMPFWIDAFSNAGVIACLWWWRLPPTPRRLPSEHFSSAVRTGLRHAHNNPHLRATLMRAMGFMLFASAYWALLPLVARERIVGNAALYGTLLGAIGVGAVLGAVWLPRLRVRLGADRLLNLAALGTAIAMVGFAMARSAAPALCASLLAGFSWIGALSSLNVSAQVALPEWVRGRGLAVFVTVQFGSMSLGSALWGGLAQHVGLPLTLSVAALGSLIAVALTQRWKLQTGAAFDFTPSMHWPAPVTTHAVDPDRGPVLVTVDYQINPVNRDAFLQVLNRRAHERRRDGAYDWHVFEDPAKDGRMVETFLTDSWIEHQRLHERVTKSDRAIEQELARYLVGGAPTTTHLIDAMSQK